MTQPGPSDDENPSRIENTVRLTLLVSFGTALALYVASLSQDCCFIGKENPQPVPPVAILIFGMFSGAAAWFANPALIAGWWCLRQEESRPLGLVVLILALGLALSFQLQIGEEIMTHQGGGVQKPVAGVGPGYWIWVGSILVSCVGGGIAWASTPDEATGDFSFGEYLDQNDDSGGFR